MRQLAPAAILVAAALVGVGAGALTPKPADDDPAPVDSTAEPSGLLYYADGSIYDDGTEQPLKLESGRRVVDLVRTSVGWAFQVEWGTDRGTLVLQRGDEVYVNESIGSGDRFDVSYDGSMIAYPQGDRVAIVEAATGRRADTVDPKMADVDAVFFSDDSLIVAGTNTRGASRITLWAMGNRRTYELPLNLPNGFVTPADVTTTGGILTITFDRAGTPCAALLPLGGEEPVWGDPDCQSRLPDDSLSPDAGHLVTYPATAAPNRLGTLTLRNLDDLTVENLEKPTPTVTIGNGDVVDAGWVDDRHLLIAETARTAPASHVVSYCTAEGTCDRVGDTHSGPIVIGRVD